MTKIKHICISLFLLLAAVSCYDMSLEPKGITDDQSLFGNEFGVKKYLAGLYNRLPIEDFNYHVDKGFRFDNYWEAPKGYMMDIAGEAVGWPWGVDGASGFDYWPYDRIREINTMIENFPLYKDNYKEEDYNSLMGEAHFIRAFYYFGLAKRYGGVPIVEEVQDPTAPEEELQVARATESELYRFIHSDLKFAMDNMHAETERGRANKFVAAAVMSRAMLYAGTIAKYGAYTTASSEPAAKAGHVGIPASEATWFFTEAYNAALFFETQQGGYTLYQKHADKEQNFVDLFLDLDSKEDIFVKEYTLTAHNNTRLKHNYDALMSPQGDFVSDVGAGSYPSLETLEKFQDLGIVNTDGTPRRFNSREELWQNLEPRLLASVYFSGMELRGANFDIRRGLYRTFNVTADAAQLGSTEAPVNSNDNRIIPSGRDDQYNDERIAGKHGAWNRDIENNTITGMFVRKYVNYEMAVEDARLYNSDQPWKVIRYAEVLLNRAEAAYELYLLDGNTSYQTDAFAQIALIRDRAGATSHTFSGSPGVVQTINGQNIDENLQFIRDERYRELLFENHYWWDIRRWRVADRLLNQHRPLGLFPYLVLDENKYIFLKEYNMENKSFNFEVRHYYESIPAGELNRNPKLIQNPIY